ncbi:MAG: hypothetical protein M3O41_09365 [Pseudomonadota bacterium]|nr:hypothetical protein [Pseudomonadota bacterium]
MWNHVITTANEPARRFRLIWLFVAFCISGVFLIIGAGNAVGGGGITAGSSFSLLDNIEPGGQRTHGFILMALALFLVWGMPDFRRITRVALIMVMFYAVLVALLIFGSWVVNKITWGGPWWYLFVASLSAGLLVLSPPLGSDGHMYRGDDGS